MPHLADGDIEALLDVLDRENRLGILKGKPRPEQVEAFRGEAGRQLLVAMLSATSGRKFEDRIRDEMAGLESEAALAYGLVAIATAVRYGLTRDEILLATQDASNETLNGISRLQSRGLVISTGAGELRVRHRLIAEVLLDSLASDGRLEAMLTRLAVAAASKVGPNSRRGSREYRRIRSLMNHDFLSRHVGPQGGLRVYSELEAFMQWDYHYWLQRGSLELEAGDIQLAENFLSQAYSLEPADPLVMTEFAFLQLKLAVNAPSGDEARTLLEEGRGLLEDAIRRRSGSDPHQYDIYARQVLEFVRRGDVGRKERGQLLDAAVKLVEEGRASHPRDERLREVYVRIQNERLALR